MWLNKGLLLTKGLMLSEENVTDMEYIHKRIALTFTLLTFALLIILGISEAFLGLPTLIVWVKIGLSFPFLFAYFFVTKYGRIQLAIHSMLGLGHVFIFCNFIFNNGNDGPTIYAFFLMLVVYSLLVQGWTKVLWFIFSLSSFFLIFYAEAFGYLDVTNNYLSIQNQFFDHAISVLWMSFFVFTILHFFISSYQNQNKVLDAIKLRQDQTLDEVKMLNDQKNKLIALLSHDLKNPIGMLHTTLELVEKDAFDQGEMEQILKSLKGQSFHLNKVLNNTLSWVMTELEDTPVQLHETSLTELTHDMKEMMIMQAIDKNQKIEVKITGEDLGISLEVNEIRIVLKNILDNAIKFAPVNSTINLDLTIDKEKFAWKVCNQGLTISEKEQKELFSFRARTSYGTKKEKGTGVGLPLCKKIADKINFDLKYSSKTDGRNCFTLSKKIA